MPPILPRKRLQSDSPAPEPSAKRPARNAPRRRVKESIFQTLDTPPTVSRSLSQTEALLGQEDDDSSLSELESSEDEFEDVLTNGNLTNGKGKQKVQDAESSADEEDWEDALADRHGPTPVISDDINITFSSVPNQTAFASELPGKKGATKTQRHFRNMTHCMHVQFLMFHNLIRNSWIQDKELQKILLQKLPLGCWKEIERYWRDSGIQDGPERVVAGAYPGSAAKDPHIQGQWKETGKQGVKEYTPGEGKTKSKAGSSTPLKSKGGSKAGPSKGRAAETPDTPRTERDWGAASERLEPNSPNLSAGDPLLRLLRYLTSFWKSKFKVSAPCLRKRGYLPPAALAAETAAWKEDPSDTDKFGERIENLDSFRELARRCEGSRDVGQQLFTALLRGLGIQARMVASLQPVGFGWSQAEEGKAKNLEKAGNKLAPPGNNTSKTSSPVKPIRAAQAVNGTRVSVDLSGDESSDLSSVVSISSDSGPRPTSTKRPLKSRKYGDELPYPTYWTEAISHLTHTPISVSPLPRSLIASSSSPDSLTEFYCRGAAADRAKQVFAYLIAFSSDGTAKDVTTRYLPKQQWPGKTKGFRVPVEKVPIYNKRGKVKKWEEWDWFKSVLRPYARSLTKRQPWDEIEDEGDLVPKKPTKPKTMDEEGGKETLQGYKDSAEYVLERHLRREEALKPGAKIVRYFRTGKGDNEKNEPVYYRKDIVSCKTVESWHKEGREVKEGEQPLKYVPMRAVTVTRKREIEERERLEGEKVKQGLYSRAQTDWIIPEPIKDGKIPRNAFGNIDVYVPTMIPQGAVHIPLKGTARVCRKLGVDYAEACTGFEFGKQRAVPVLTGVVVAVENEDLVIDAWEADEAEKRKKEEAKRETLVLGAWKRFAIGLKIVERMKREYGDDAELPAPGPKLAIKGDESKKSEWETFQSHAGGFEGGFIRDEAGDNEQPAGGFFHADGATDPAEGAGGFLRDEEASNADHQLHSQESLPHRNSVLTIDHGEDHGPLNSVNPAENIRHMPISLQAALQKNSEEGVSDEERDEKDEEGKSVIDTVKSGPIRRTAAHPKASSSRRRTSTRKQLDDAGDIEGSAQSDADDDFSATLKGKRRASRRSPSTRAVPKRTAAKKANAKVTSHFFARSSDEDTDKAVAETFKGGKGRRSGRVGN
jgi:xeroderma pigmentosum group C-complementing protein